MPVSRNTVGGGGRRRPDCDLQNWRSLDWLAQGRRRLPAQVAGARGGVSSVGGQRRSAPTRRQLRAAVAGSDGYVQRLEALVAVLMRINSGLEERKGAMERWRAAERRRAAGAAGGGPRAGGDGGDGDASGVGPGASEAGASTAFEGGAGEESGV
jgi:hypothetical protein